MDLFKWTKNLTPAFPNIVEKFFGKKIDEQASDSEIVSIVPAVNISDKNKAFEVSVAVPGLDKKDVKVEVQNGVLILSSEKQYEKEENEGRWMRKEYGYAAFQRMFQLPDNADSDNIQATMKNGVLNIKVGKVKGTEERMKRIAVQ